LNFGAIAMLDTANFDNMDKQIICELLESGMVDGDLLIRIAQIMMLPEFNAFFEALGKIDLTEVDQSAGILREVAQKLVQPN